MIRISTLIALLSTLCTPACSDAPGTPTQESSYDEGAKWAASATFTDACCCNASCPCLFGSKPSLGHCDGITLLEFDRAHYDGVKLDGLKVVAVYRSKRSMNYYVSDKATKAQTDAVVALIPKYIKFYDLKKVTSVKNVAIDVQRTAGKVKVTTPEANMEIAVMKAKDGSPIKLQNMPAPEFPAPAFLDHTQYKSVALIHKGKGEEFDYSGTNGFVAKLATMSSSN